jgi:predicted amidohydrolase YtcJ
MLREAASAPVLAAIAKQEARLSPQERDRKARYMMELAARDALSKGITSFQDAGSSFEQIDRFIGWAADGALPLRLYVMVSYEEDNENLAARLADYRIIPEANDFLAVRSIKRLADGALGSHGALHRHARYDRIGDRSSRQHRGDRSNRTATRVSGKHARDR